MVGNGPFEGTVTAQVLPDPDTVTRRIHDSTTESDALYPSPGIPAMLPDAVTDTVALVSNSFPRRFLLLSKIKVLTHSPPFSSLLFYVFF